jgi:DNA polymerase-4
MIESRGCTLVGITLTNLEGGYAIQLSLPFGRRPIGPLDAAVDELRERFGSAAITRAALVGREQGFTVPLLPD